MSEDLKKYGDLLGGDSKALANLGTVMSSGAPQVTPVWFDYDGKHFRVNSAKGRVKDRNMRRNPAVALSIVDPGNPYRYLGVLGPRRRDHGAGRATPTSTAWPRSTWARIGTRTGSPARSASSTRSRPPEPAAWARRTRRSRGGGAGGCLGGTPGAAASPRGEPC